jgi:hypothetical protein
VWAVLGGSGALRASDSTTGAQAELEITAPGAYPLIEHVRHTRGMLTIELDPGVSCAATSFTPGVA